jgi:hypothetical protein
MSSEARESTETYDEWWERVNGPKIRDRRQRMASIPDWHPEYEPWRHGGWYVTNICYPSGAVGCVSRNYPDRKWRIVDQNHVPGSPEDVTYKSRDEAAYAERQISMARRAAA